VAQDQGIKADLSITVNRPLEELYRFWLNFENLPCFMLHLKSVRRLDALRSHWVAMAPTGLLLEWDTAVHHVIPCELIAWRSLPDAGVDASGSVCFRPSSRGGGRGTELRVCLCYEPQTVRLRTVVARLFGPDPDRQLGGDLRRFKALTETGELATIDGQPSGRWEAPRAGWPDFFAQRPTPVSPGYYPAWAPTGGAQRPVP
jgi:uncharacterized membrane protein